MKISCERVVMFYDQGQRPLWTATLSEADARAADQGADKGGDLDGGDFERSLTWFELPSGKYALSFGRRGKDPGGRAFQAHTTFVISADAMRGLQFNPFPLFEALQVHADRYDALQPDLEPIEVEVSLRPPSEVQPVAQPAILAKLIEALEYNHPTVFAVTDTTLAIEWLREAFSVIPPSVRMRGAFSTFRSRRFDDRLRLIFCPARDQSSFEAGTEVCVLRDGASVELTSETGRDLLGLLGEDREVSTMRWLATKADAGAISAHFDLKSWIGLVHEAVTFEQWRRAPESVEIWAFLRGMDAAREKLHLSRYGFGDFAGRALPQVRSLKQAAVVLDQVGRWEDVDALLKANGPKIDKLLENSTRPEGLDFVSRMAARFPQGSEWWNVFEDRVPQPPKPPPVPVAPVPKPTASRPVERHDTRSASTSAPSHVPAEPLPEDPYFRPDGRRSRGTWAERIERKVRLLIERFGIGVVCLALGFVSGYWTRGWQQQPSQRDRLFPERESAPVPESPARLTNTEAIIPIQVPIQRSDALPPPPQAGATSNSVTPTKAPKAPP